MTQLFFERFNQFVQSDNRKDRQWVPSTAESLTRKHETIAPAWLVKDASILDLGSCIGATGHWCLAQGARHYVGVEAQEEYVNISRQLLANEWPADRFEIVSQDIESFLANNAEQFDCVFACGVIYAFLDTYGLLKMIAATAQKAIMIDTAYPSVMSQPNDSYIEIFHNQYINRSKGVQHYSGLGSRPTPLALERMMSNLGWVSGEGLLYPQQLTDHATHDAYHTRIMRSQGLQNPARYLVRFTPGGQSVKTASEALLTDDRTRLHQSLIPLHTYPKISPWTFDDAVAQRFQTEADTHIPDYRRVIDLSVDMVSRLYDRSARIVDVGSALGFTVDRFLTQGYDHVQGLEISTSMRNHSLHQERILLADRLPQARYHAILINWTLHFMTNRVDYLRDVHDRLLPGGLLILTDKMTQSLETKQAYYAWKIANGVSQDTIREKEHRLKGVLETKPLAWYLDSLESLGFQQIEMVNSRFCFNTLICRRP